MALQLVLLGVAQAWLDQQAIDLATRKAWALLGYLALRPRPHAREELAALLWPDADADHARGALRFTLATLKRALGAEYILADRQRISLNWNLPIEVDALQLRQVAANSELAHLKTVLQHYRGRLLEGLSLEDCPEFEQWQLLEAEQLQHHYLDLADQLSLRLQHQHHPSQAIDVLQRRLLIDPLHEQSYYRLMQCYAQLGNRSAALNQYVECERVLQTELGLAPNESISQLYQQIKQGHGVTQSVASNPGMALPKALTHFIGRQHELEQLEQWLQQEHLISIIGAGGIGKTRLALQLAQQQQFAGRLVVFVECVAAEHYEALLAGIGHSAGVNGGREQPLLAQLIQHFNQQPSLLILDNLEHVLIDARLLIESLLQQTHHLTIVATSRERLNLSMEWVLDLSGLAYPQDDCAWEEALSYSAVALFIQRASQSFRRFNEELDQATQQAILIICRLVEGMPLGLELAATWVRSLSCPEIAQEIQQNLDFLTTQYHNIPLRHRGLRAVFEHSWQLLTSIEQQILASLAIFRGVISRAALQAVLPQRMSNLASLIDKSLLRRNRADSYQLHELLRQFAFEQLQAQPTLAAHVQAEHANYYASFVHEQHQAWDSPSEQQAMLTLQQALDNIQVAWLWACRQQQFGLIEKITEGLFDLYLSLTWFQVGYEQFKLAYQACVNADQLDLALRLAARCAQFCYEQGQLDQALQHLEWGWPFLASLVDPAEAAFAAELYGLVHYRQQQLGLAQTAMEQALDWAKQGHDQGRLAHILLSYGAVLNAQKAYSQAKQALTQSQALYRQLEKQWGVAHTSRFLATIALVEAEYELAQDLHQQSLLIFQQLSNRLGIILAYTSLGDLARIQLKPRDSLFYYQEALHHAQHLPQSPSVGNLLWGLSQLLQHWPNRTAQQHYELAMLGLSQLILHPSCRGQLYEQAITALAELQRHLGPQRALQLQTQGQQLSLADFAHEVRQFKPEFDTLNQP